MKSQSFFAFGEPQDCQCKSVLNSISFIPKYHPQVGDEVAFADKELRACALKLAQKGNYNDAIALLSQLINRHPQNAVDYNNRGLIYFQSGDRQKAVCDYNTALELNPKLASAYNNRANYYAACGELATAIADYDRALDLNPSYVRGWINRAITLRELGKYAEAIENLEVALLFGQLESHILAQRGRTYHIWGDWNCAIADYQRTLMIINTNNKQNKYSTSSLRLQVESWLNKLMGFSNSI
ncbi:MAG: tetratricopeptide repeat protein [Calothrix sp. MO_167.B12]|nr:tetratricopeptide repeat protein [Calothrix sp. MO_167.B12]